MNGFDNKSKLIFIIAGIALLSLFFTIFSQKNKNETHPVYTKPNKIEQVSVTPEPTKPAFEAQIYTYSDPDFSINIPSDWDKVIKSGYDTYIHKATGASIQIKVHNYDPNVNNITAETENNNVLEKGMTFLGFTKTSTSSYEVLYQDIGTTTFDYIDEIYWDREYIVELNCIFDDYYYKDLKDIYDTMIHSFVWNKSDPIPADYYLTYFPDGFEAALPDAWLSSMEGDSLYSYDEATGAYLTYAVGGSIDSLSSITANDMISQMQDMSMSGFFMDYFSATDELVKAQASYYLGDVKWHEEYYILKDIYSTYHIRFFYPDGVLLGDMPGDIVGLFRSFNVEDTIE